MKIFVEQYETIIEGYLKPLAAHPKQGEIIPHQKMVNKVYFYQRHFINDQEVFLKIELSRKMLLDLSDKIQDIEGQIVDTPYDELPF